MLWLFVFCGLLLAALVLALLLRMRGGPGTVIPWIGFAGKSPADANVMRVMEDEARRLADIERPKELAP